MASSQQSHEKQKQNVCKRPDISIILVCVLKFTHISIYLTKEKSIQYFSRFSFPFFLVHVKSIKSLLLVGLQRNFSITSINIDTCRWREKVGQLQLVSNFCMHLINPTFHMTFQLYSVAGYSLWAFWHLLMCQTVICQDCSTLFHRYCQK